MTRAPKRPAQHTCQPHVLGTNYIEPAATDDPHRCPACRATVARVLREVAADLEARGSVFAAALIETRPPSGYVHVAGYSCGHVHRARPDAVRDNMRATVVGRFAAEARRLRARATRMEKT